MTDIALALALPVTVGLFVWLANRKDERMWREVQTLLNRIQSPETAVAQTLVLDDNDIPPVPPTEYEAHEKLMAEFTDA